MLHNFLREKPTFPMRILMCSFSNKDTSDPTSYKICVGIQAFVNPELLFGVATCGEEKVGGDVKFNLRP